ncbi:MAG: hypothetical protein V3V40_06055 [Nitrosomonadaceae bacterium]
MNNKRKEMADRTGLELYRVCCAMKHCVDKCMILNKLLSQRLTPNFHKSHKTAQKTAHGRAGKVNE